MTDAAAPHLDLDTLADALAGEADRPARAHLAGCGSCASRLAELEAAEQGVRATLAALPPPPLPAGLADRLSAALAGRPPATATASVTALPQRTRRRWLPAAAAAVLLVSGGGLGYALLAGGSSGDDPGLPAGTGGSAQRQAAALVLNSSGTDYGDTAAVQRVLPEVLQGAAGTAGVQEAPAAAGRSSEDTAASAPAPAAAMAAADPLARLRTPDGLADCLAALLPPEEPGLRPRALDYAQYQGRPALAVVLPDPDPAKLSVFVVGPGCSRADDSTLHFFRLDAP